MYLVNIAYYFQDILSRGFLIWAFIFNVVLATTPDDEEGTNREEKSKYIFIERPLTDYRISLNNVRGH